MCRRLEIAPAASSSTPPPPSPATLKTTPTWKRPLAPGVIKAYDEALALVRKDANLKIQEVQQLKKTLKASPERDTPEERRRLEKLEVESQINLPEVRWNVKNGQGEGG